MSLARVAAVVAAALLLIAGAAVYGYRQGEEKVPEEGEATRERQEAFLAAFSEASFAASNDVADSGHRAGLADGERAGIKTGIREGRLAGAEAVAEQKYLVSSEREPEPKPRGPVSGDVLVVGDSLEVLTEPYLKQYLPTVDVTHNAVGGYNSIQIFGLFSESFTSDHDVVVFDAGTNDNPSYPQILASNLEKVAQTVGDRCLVVPTIHGLSVGGVDSSGKNEVVRSFAASRPGTEVPNWAQAVANHPELMQPDDLHPIAEGADYRARLIARGVRRCLLSSSGSGFG